MKLAPAQRKQVKLRIGIMSPSGFGKTYSGLRLAYGMCHNWGKVAVIDTENESAALYANDGKYIGTFLHLPMNTYEIDLGGNRRPIENPYSPERFIQAIRICEAAGVDVILLDSVSREWDGKGGCLEIVEKLGGRYQDWNKVTPRHQAFIDAILHSPCHVITTTRRKQDYEMSKDEKGKTRVEKAGLKEIQRDGFEYELTINFAIINGSHLAEASKDRTGLFADQPATLITEKTGELIMAWMESGAVLEVELYDGRPEQGAYALDTMRWMGIPKERWEEVSLALPGKPMTQVQTVITDAWTALQRKEEVETPYTGSIDQKRLIQTLCVGHGIGSQDGAFMGKVHERAIEGKLVVGDLKDLVVEMIHPS